MTQTANRIARHKGGSGVLRHSSRQVSNMDPRQCIRWLCDGARSRYRLPTNSRWRIPEGAWGLGVVLDGLAGTTLSHRPDSGAGEPAGVTGSRVAVGHHAVTRSALDAVPRRAESGAQGRRLRNQARCWSRGIGISVLSDGVHVEVLSISQTTKMLRESLASLGKFGGCFLSSRGVGCCHPLGHGSDVTPESASFSGQQCGPQTVSSAENPVAQGDSLLVSRMKDYARTGEVDLFLILDQGLENVGRVDWTAKAKQDGRGADRLAVSLEQARPKATSVDHGQPLGQYNLGGHEELFLFSGFGAPVLLEHDDAQGGAGRNQGGQDSCSGADRGNREGVGHAGTLSALADSRGPPWRLCNARAFTSAWALSVCLRGVRWGARRARSARSAEPHRGAPRRGGAALEPVRKVLTRH